MNINYLTQLYLLFLTINCYSIKYEFQKKQYKKFLNNIDNYFNEFTENITQYIDHKDEIIELTFNNDDSIDIYSNKGVDNETINYVLKVLIDQEIIDNNVSFTMINMN